MMKVVGFSAVDAYATPGEYAYLYDTGGHNTFNGTPSHSWLVTSSCAINASGFYTVTAYGGAGNTDVAYLKLPSGGRLVHMPPHDVLYAGNGHVLDDVWYYYPRVYPV